MYLSAIHCWPVHTHVCDGVVHVCECMWYVCVMCGGTHDEVKTSCTSPVDPLPAMTPVQVCHTIVHAWSIWGPYQVPD